MRILISEKKIKNRVRKIARIIESDYRNKRPVMVGILKGAVVFLADLIRELEIPIEIDFIAVSRYRGRTKSTGRVKILEDLSVNIGGKDVILVEDIVDTGSTLDRIIKRLNDRKPKSLVVCALLNKEANRKVAVPLRYVGFKIPNKFLVGYGLDFKNRHRNLKFIGALNGR